MSENVKGFKVPTKNRTYPHSESTGAFGKQACPPKARVTGGSPNKYGPDKVKPYGAGSKK